MLICTFLVINKFKREKYIVKESLFISQLIAQNNLKTFIINCQVSAFK